MNYVRGAFSAVTQYYTNLPPINASTLTGAIDVIVVEHRDEVTGGTELACSPFHVRLGKWQVLRPGEKQVTVLVNGQPIPYSMKIGDAGEAFFVFETDEDVPEELMTSPILGPTNIQGTRQENTDAERQHASAGRFGAHDSDGEDPSTPRSGKEKPSLAGTSGVGGHQMREPTFLDLDGGSPSSTGNSTASSSPTSSTTPDVQNLSSNSQISLDSPPTSPPASSSLLALSKNVLTTGPKLAKSVLTSAPNTAADNAKKAWDHIHDAREKGALPSQLQRRDSDDDGRPLTSMSDEAAKPPDVRYGHDVVLDMEGYHNADAVVEEKSREGMPDSLVEKSSELQFNGNDSDSGAPKAPHMDSTPRTSATLPLQRASQDLSRTASNPGPSSGSAEPFPSSDSSTPLEVPKLKGGNYIRGGSAPPDLELSLDHATISTSPPDYTWEWGAFPTRSPARRTFPLAKDDSAVVGPSHLGTSVTTLRDEIDGDETEAEEEMFGKGGKLTPDERDDKRFWVSMEGKMFSFELSLCGREEGNKTRWDEVESARWFDDRKIQYERLLRDPEVAERLELVMKWGDKYITRRDSSPLLQALLLWRCAMRPIDDNRRPIPSSVSDPELSSPPISPGLPPLMNKRASGSSWGRWWTRARDREDSTSTIRPQFPPASSAPGKLDTPEGEHSVPSNTLVPTSPPMGTAKTAPASVALPASRSSSPPPRSPVLRKNYVKTLRLTSDQLKGLNLKKGANTVTFSLSATGVVACTAKIFVWESTDHVVVSDIDGTITKSDALGHMFNLIGRDWTHLGVAKLYTDIARNGYKMMYLTSRAIGQADSTRDYLKGVKQNNYQLPEGPVIMSPDRLMTSLHREVILKKPEVFKMACLRDIQRLFGPWSITPFYAGFGNRITDALSYRSVNVPSARIFTIDSSGEVKMELLELAGYKSSYIHMTDLVDQMFPPVHRKWAPEYTDFNYWRDPIVEFDLPDLEPPSPALSAVSDASAASRFSRIRNFSLRSTGSGSNVAEAATAVSRLRKEISPSPLVRSILSSDDNRSTTLADSDEERHHRRSRRKLSFDSIPGSLPGSEYGSDDEEDGEEGMSGDEEEEEDGDEEGEGEEEEEDPPVFEDDFLREVESAPFI